MNKLKISDNKKILVSFLILILLFVLVNGIEKLMYINSKTTCGEFIREFSGKGTTSYVYKIKVFNNIYEGNIQAMELTEKIEDLKKDSCVMIEYSVYSPSWYNRVVDKRILKD